MLEIKDFSYNIFENVSKEQFIKEVNSKDKKSILSILSSILSFDYIKNARVIVDINNYDDEILYFNSFDIFKDYENKKFMIEENFQKYLDSRNIKQITYQRKLRKEFYAFSSIESFKDYLNKKDKIQRSKEISDILIEEFEQPIIKKLEKSLSEVFSFFDFDNHLETTYEIKFQKFNRLSSENLLTDEHLDGQVFNNLTLYVYGKTGEFFSFENFRNKGVLIDNFTKIQTDYFDNINLVAELSGYKAYIVKLDIFIFKKIQ